MSPDARLDESGVSETFEQVGCPLCGGSASDGFADARDYNKGIPGIFHYVRCRGCSLVFLNPRPRPERMEDVYVGSRECASMGQEGIDAKIEVPVNAARADFVSAHCAGRSIYDVGCGCGWFLEHMRRRGWNVSGLDMDAESVAFARDRMGLTGVQTGRWGAGDRRIQADVVSLVHALEHMPDPVGALAAAKEALLPGGVVFVETPNIGSWPARLFGRRWVTLDAPRHMALFSPETLRKAMEKAGLRVIALRSSSPSTMEYSESIRYLLQDWGLRRKPSGDVKESMDGHRTLKKSRRSAFHAIELMLYRKINAVSNAMGNGCNLMVVGSQ